MYICINTVQITNKIHTYIYTYVGEITIMPSKNTPYCYWTNRHIHQTHNAQLSNTLVYCLYWYTPHPHHSLYIFLHRGETGPHAAFLLQQPQVGL